jgi:hypothetical protein
VGDRTFTIWAAGLATLVLSLPARAEYSAKVAANLELDDYRYRTEEFRLELRRTGKASGQWLSARFYDYALSEELAGIRAFSGREAAASAGAHALFGLFWLGASAGFQGTLDLDGATASIVLARAFPSETTKFTPKLELAREPLSLTPLPLSLGSMSRRAELALDFELPVVRGTAAGRFAMSEPSDSPGRTENPDRDAIAANRSLVLYGYALAALGPWFSPGLSGKVAWAEHNTLLLTGFTPAPSYTWYPVKAPPFAWEVALVLRAAGKLAEPVDVALQLKLPLASEEIRQWESVRLRFFGTAPFEARLEASWLLDDTVLRLQASAFAEPWENWDVTAAEAYRQGSAELAVEQSF